MSAGPACEQQFEKLGPAQLQLCWALGMALLGTGQAGSALEMAGWGSRAELAQFGEQGVQCGLCLAWAVCAQ